MKNKEAAFAVFAAIAALAYSGWLHFRFEIAVSAAVDDALRRREAELVRSFAPRIAQMYADLDLDGYPADPKTFEDAAQPIFRILDAMGGEDQDTTSP